MNLKINSLYRHFKGGVYEVLLIAKDVDTLEDIVVYQNIKDKQIWTRKYTEFASQVDKEKYPDILDTYRFTEIENKNI
ncbi:MAG: DUF1653 domain-containing protein [bacterium]